MVHHVIIEYYAFDLDCPADVLLMLDATYREGTQSGGTWDAFIRDPAKNLVQALYNDNPTDFGSESGNYISAIQ